MLRKACYFILGNLEKGDQQFLNEMMSGYYTCLPALGTSVELTKRGSVRISEKVCKVWHKDIAKGIRQVESST